MKPAQKEVCVSVGYGRGNAYGLGLRDVGRQGTQCAPGRVGVDLCRRYSSRRWVRLLCVCLALASVGGSGFRIQIGLAQFPFELFPGCVVLARSFALSEPFPSTPQFYLDRG